MMERRKDGRPAHLGARPRGPARLPPVADRIRTPPPIPLADLEPLCRRLDQERAARIAIEAPHVLGCVYCLGTFRSARAHAETCCNACRTATCRALGLACDADIAPVSMREDSYSDARAEATGIGTMTASQCLAADRRVRAQARKRARTTRASRRRAARRYAKTSATIEPEPGLLTTSTSR